MLNYIEADSRLGYEASWRESVVLEYVAMAGPMKNRTPACKSNFINYNVQEIIEEDPGPRHLWETAFYDLCKAGFIIEDAGLPPEMEGDWFYVTELGLKYLREATE